MKKLSTRTKAIILGILALGVVGMLSHDWSSNGCVDVTIGSVQLSVPQQHMAPKSILEPLIPISRRSGSVNFIFAFDSSVPEVECPMWCKELFVNILSAHPTPEQRWEYLKPKFTGRTIGSYRVYLDNYSWRSSGPPMREILVPMDTVRPQDEFYNCTPERQGKNALCMITVVDKSGLTAQFSIPRKSLSKTRDAASFVTQKINQFSENHTKGICK